MNKENTVEQAGGFIIQLMPFAEEEVIEKLEKKVAEVTSVTSLLAQGYNPEMIVKLDSTKLQELGWKATVGLREMYERLIESMSLVH